MNSENVPARKLSRVVRLLRWLALGVVALVTLVALFYAIENFRGKRTWARYAKDAEQRGLMLDFAAQIPPAVPHDQNAANIPLIQAWFDPRFGRKHDPVLWPDLHERAANMMGSDRDKTKRRLIDLVVWEKAFAASEANEKREQKFRPQNRTPKERAAAATNVLAALRVYDPALDQLREATKRPHVRYPVDYNVEQPFSILLPHLAGIRDLSRVIGLRASVNLAAGHSDAAAQDVLLSLWLVESLKDEHFLISYLVRAACLQMASHAVWEGMVQQRWTDAQLKIIQERAASIDFLRGLQRALDTERAAGITTIDWIKERKSGQRFEALVEPNANVGKYGFSLMSLMPRGWWDLEKVSYARLFEQDAGPVFAALGAGTLANAPDANLAAKNLHRGPAAIWHHEIMAALLLPALDKVQRKAGMAQALADEMVVACALERARLADGSYPSSLAALTPKFLSQSLRDVMTGEPLVYRTEGNGYVLYSVGWNRTDDGGAPGKHLFDEERGDWIWRVQPVTAAEFE